ncbi:hypothetical protein EDM68_00860 [Candidatus Uhrbacteria bacterium]|nr:MAG: hypothetical protein EDM68_00860 [Candidatus Uhrbacteria bacterium]
MSLSNPTIRANGETEVTREGLTVSVEPITWENASRYPEIVRSFTIGPADYDELLAPALREPRDRGHERGVEHVVVDRAVAPVQAALVADLRDQAVHAPDPDEVVVERDGSGADFGVPQAEARVELVVVADHVAGRVHGREGARRLGELDVREAVLVEERGRERREPVHDPEIVDGLVVGAQEGPDHGEAVGPPRRADLLLARDAGEAAVELLRPLLGRNGLEPPRPEAEHGRELAARVLARPALAELGDHDRALRGRPELLDVDHDVGEVAARTLAHGVVHLGERLAADALGRAREHALGLGGDDPVPGCRDDVGPSLGVLFHVTHLLVARSSTRTVRVVAHREEGKRETRKRPPERKSDYCARTRT